MSKRIRDLNSPVTRFLRRAVTLVVEPLARLSDTQQFWLGFGALAVLTALLIQNPFWQSVRGPEYQPGDIAKQQITAPADIYSVDEVATELDREDARRKFKPIFRYSANRGESAVQAFVSVWENIRSHPGQLKAKSNTNASGDTQWPGSADAGKVMAARRYTANEIEAVKTAIREAASGYIYDDSEKQYFADEVTIFDRSRPGARSTVTLPETNWTSLSEAREGLRLKLSAIRSFSGKEIEAFYSAGQILIEPSVTFDSVATEAGREAATAAVQPRVINLKRGQKVVGDGEVITSDALAKIAAVYNFSSKTRQANRFLGLLVIVASLYWVAWRFVQHRGVVPRLALTERRTFALLGFVVLVQTLIASALFRLVEFTAAQNVSAPLNDALLWSLAIPVATGSLVMALLADRPTALVAGVVNSLITGLLAPRGIEFAAYSAIVSSVAVYGISRYRSRQTVTLAGGLIGAASAVLGIALVAFTQVPFTLNTVLLAIACGLAGGIITAAVTAVLLPVCESFFGILTDVKLLELSNADLPVLGQLALRAPGTNQHSHAVGQLAEEACRVVGANGLLARIGSLYHDIGKTAAPEHFVENQQNENPHDRLNPIQSAKIIISHVTYGMKLGKEIGLPARIVDFIPQHHGTRTLHYFLKKAQAQARPDEIVDENDFRYPGPKPQFKEAAIMMIADSCEAAARSLAEPTPENIRFIVTKIVDAILADDQLDECDLTLRELTRIREAMIRSLVAIYHSRVDYPGYVPPTSGQFRLADEVETTGKMRYSDPAEIPVSPGGEIEDEAIDRSHQPNRAEGTSAK
ncbi:MAG: HDIG domain-containing protein [Chloracidobacterium sp.]|nr:HDIG domain-containing protein [Chloracidobacterium sp.]